MTKILNPETFRFYEEGGIKIPSVTTILQLHPEPEYIGLWKERIGIQGYIDHMQKLADRGTLLHKVCENYFLGNNNIIPTELEYQRFINGFYTFVGKYGQYISPLDNGEYRIEYNLYSDVLGYAGTCDFICNIDGKQTLIDWKTSSHSQINSEMLEKYKMQTIAYAVLYNNYHEDKIKQIMIVTLTDSRKDGLGQVVGINSSHFESYFNNFLTYLIEFNLVYNDGFKVNYDGIVF